MSHELWANVLKRIDYGSLSAQMVFQCAPLFAGLKVSNLLKIPEEDQIRAIRLIRELGYACRILLTRNGKVTMLVYDPGELTDYLCRSEVKDLLKKFGYLGFSLSQLLRQFVERYREYGAGVLGYPHETGLFLGYPAADVEGFILHEGKAFLHSGYWKVYQNAAQQIELFRRFEDAKRKMLFQLARGRALTDFLADGSFYENSRVASL